MSNQDPPREKTIVQMLRLFWSVVKKWVVLPIIATLLGAMLIGRVSDWILGPKAYKIYLVGGRDLSLGETDPVEQIWKGFKEDAGKLGEINGVPVAVDTIDDLGDPNNALTVATRLTSLNDTLMVVGHVYSTQSRAALPVYMYKASPPIPVILTTETNPDLLPPKASQDTYYPVFRIPPTDRKQAKSAAQFMASKGAKNIWVVQDTSNPVYSSFLAREFIAKVHEEKTTRVLLWSTNLGTPSPEAVKSLGIDWAFFAGDWPNGLILIRQLKSMLPTHDVQVLLSDGCVDPHLITEGGDDVTGVYLSSPMSAKRYRVSGNVAYGEDAVKITEQILDQARMQFFELAKKEGGSGYWVRKLLGLRRVSDARNVLSRVMYDSVFNGRKFSLADGTELQFVSDANENTANFYIWQIRERQFTDIQ